MHFILTLVILALAAPALAQPTDIYPVLDGGVVRVIVQAGASDPARPDTASVGVIQTNAGVGETLLLMQGGAPACANLGPTQSILFSTVVVENPGGGADGIVKARGYTMADCAGDLYNDSANTAFVRFVGPSSPAIMPEGTTIDFTIP
jgi:hypothetical protein